MADRKPVNSVEALGSLEERAALARQTDMPEWIANILMHDDAYVVHELLRNHNWPSSLILTSLNSLCDRGTDWITISEILNILPNDKMSLINNLWFGRTHIQCWVATQPECSSSILDNTNSSNKDPMVSWLIARHRNASSKVLRKLAEHPYLQARIEVAKNPNTPLLVALDLAEEDMIIKTEAKAVLEERIENEMSWQLELLT